MLKKSSNYFFKKESQKSSSLISSLGSLIIDFDVITKSTEKGLQELAMAVAKMKTASENNHLLKFGGDFVPVNSISLNGTKGEFMYA